MIKTILIDDEPLARSLVREFLAAYPDMEIVAECNDGFEGLKAIQQFEPDLIFLDIQMPRINGFEMLELADHPPAVIFTTAYDEYAIRAFDSQAVDYLLKPFSRERFDKAITRWRELFENRNFKPATDSLLETASLSPQQRERIVVKSGHSIVVIPVGEIHYLEAADDYVKIFTSRGSWLKNRTMSQFEAILDPAFFLRVHRSFIVNLSEINRVEPHEKDSHVLLLRNGKVIPVSKSGMIRLREALG
jgi:two-component system LytT family response regulator